MPSPDFSHKFARYNLSPTEEASALQVSDLFLLYLKNKIADYAEAVVEKALPYSADPTKQVEAILAHEKLKHFVEAYEELMSEIIQALPQPTSTTPE
jgi:hypothetical protein